MAGETKNILEPNELSEDGYPAIPCKELSEAKFVPLIDRWFYNKMNKMLVRFGLRLVH